MFNGLKDYQRLGVKFLASRQVALLADEMGLGKSAQAIAAMDLLKAKRVLIICPAIARFNWLNEFNKFSTEKRNFEIQLSRSPSWDPKKSIIASYDVCPWVKDPGEFDVVVLDEAHFLKNKTASRTKAVLGSKGIVRYARKIWAMTGTPMPNNPSELWTVAYSFGMTKLTYAEFIQKFCVVENTGYGTKIIGARKENIPELKELLSKFMLRRKKQDVLKELPPITYGSVTVAPGKVDISASMSFYAQTKRLESEKSLEETVEDQQKLLIDAISKASTPEQQLEILKAMATSVSTLRRYMGMQKIDPVYEMVKEELENNAYDKIVIFALHRDVVRFLQDKLKPYGAVTVYGGHDPIIRENNIKKFQTKHSCRVMIANITAASTAVNLTAANQVLFVEQDWVPGNNAQSVMRCHRIGQKNPVYVRTISIANSIDGLVQKVLAKKTEDITEIMC